MVKCYYFSFTNTLLIITWKLCSNPSRNEWHSLSSMLCLDRHILHLCYSNCSSSKYGKVLLFSTHTNFFPDKMNHFLFTLLLFLRRQQNENIKYKSSAKCFIPQVLSRYTKKKRFGEGRKKLGRQHPFLNEFLTAHSSNNWDKIKI